MHSVHRPWGLIGLIGGLGLLTALSGSARAHISPPGCTSNSADIDLNRFPSVLVSGGTVAYAGMLTNGGPGACDVTIFGNVVLNCPAADGTPTGTQIVVIPAVPGGRQLLADGTTDVSFGPVTCVVSGSPGQYTAEVKGAGILHDSDPDVSVEIIDKTVTVTLVECLSVADCSATPHDAQCQTLACENFACVVHDVPNDTACADSDGNLCTHPACEAGTCNQAVTTTVCTPDNNECTQDLACNPATGLCAHPPVPDGTACTDTDGNACTTPACTGGVCNQTNHTTVCTPDNNECTQDLACNTTTGQCDHPAVPPGTTCTDTDGNACTTAACEGTTCNQAHTTKTCTPDNNECTDDLACNTTTGQCDHPNKPDGTSCTDTDGLDCTLASCEGGVCNQTEENNCEAICRTVGFWQTHACGTDGVNCEKSDSFNLTQDALNLVGGSVTVCGEVINTTVVPDNNSALEALCTNGGGITQLARQLLGMALNCSVSGFNGDCSGDPSIAALFTSCNTVCTGGSVPGFSVDSCVSLVDSFNSGTSSLAFGCHNASDEDLAAALGVPQLGPAGSPNACTDARKDSCTIFSASSLSCP